MLALEHDGAGIYNIVDDEPAPVREWLPELATILGASSPNVSPASWPAFRRRSAGRDGHRVPGLLDAKAKRELGCTLRYPSGERASGR